MSYETVVVQAPATSANLGPGFDCLGLALELYCTVTVSLAGELVISARGEGEAYIDTGRENRVYRAFAALFQALEQPIPPVRIAIENGIPTTGGLGSSAAAFCAGLVAANTLAGNPLPRSRLLELADALEGHPDNAVPALVGGCTLAVKEEDRLHYASVPLPPELVAVLFVPSFRISTKKARRVLPQRVSRDDAVYNLGRVALLVLALCTHQTHYLRLATQDRLHQPYRQKRLFPAMTELFRAALEAGALGVFLSGAGSALLALAEDGAEAVAAALRQRATELGIAGRTMVTRPSAQGTTLLSAHP